LVEVIAETPNIENAFRLSGETCLIDRDEWMKIKRGKAV